MADIVPPPLSGDPETIRGFAATYRDTASALRQAASELLALSNSNVTVSLAVDEVREKATSAYDATTKVATRYDGASDTYYAYRRGLMDAQSKANTARALIDTNNGNAAYWRRRKIQLIATASISAATDPDYPKDLKEANDRVAEYDADYREAMRQYNEAVQDKADAVAIAIASLDDAASAAGLNDNFFEALSGMAQQLYELAQRYLAPLIEKLRDILELIKSIVDILSLIFTILSVFIPVLGPIAAALTAISIGLSIMIFACSLVLFALGKESLGRVISDGIGMVVGIVTSKLGGSSMASAASHAVAASSASMVTKVVTVVAIETARDGADLIVDGVSHLAETGLDIRADQFPNANGQPAGSTGVLQAGGVTWDLNTLADPEAHSAYMFDQMASEIPFYGEVNSIISNVNNVATGEGDGIGNFVFDGLAAGAS